MYLSFYGLSRPPFQTSPQPDFLFESPGHGEALASLIYGIRENRGFVAIVGEVGVGKTTTLLAALRQAQAERPSLNIIEFSNPILSPDALLGVVADRLGLSPGPTSRDDLRGLGDRLRALRDQGAGIVLVFDEAQSIPAETLEFLRILSNLDGGGEPLLMIVFSGQPEFEETMQRPENRALNQRIAIRTRIPVLTAEGARNYLRFRLEAAGGLPDEIMTAAAAREIVRLARSNPRQINILADNALVAGFGSDRKPITAADVQAASSVLGGTAAIPRDPGHSRRGRRLWPAIGAAAAAGALAMAAVLSLWGGEFRRLVPLSGQEAAPPRASAPPVDKPPPVSQAQGGNPAAAPAPREAAPAVPPPPGAAGNMPPAAVSPAPAENQAAPPPPQPAPPSAPPPADGPGRAGPAEIPATAAAPPGVSPPSSVPRPTTAAYVVQPGDNLANLLKARGLANTPAVLSWVRRLNPALTDLGLLFPGQLIVLPSGGAPTPTP